MIKNVFWSAACKVGCPILMTLEHSRQIFKQPSNIKFNENSSRGRRVVPWGRTDW